VLIVPLLDRVYHKAITTLRTKEQEKRRQRKNKLGRRIHERWHLMDWQGAAGPHNRIRPPQMPRISQSAQGAEVTPAADQAKAGSNFSSAVSAQL
jgi:hypothetical protein